MRNTDVYSNVCLFMCVSCRVNVIMRKIVSVTCVLRVYTYLCTNTGMSVCRVMLNALCVHESVYLCVE